MAIVDRVEAALQNAAEGKAEAALHDICSALEATMKAETGLEGRVAFKAFLHANADIASLVGLGVEIRNLRVEFSHPKVPVSDEGGCAIEDVLYHAIRCELYHNASLPSSIQFWEQEGFKVTDQGLVLPKRWVYGIIMTVILSPSNKDAGCRQSDKVVNLFGLYQIPLDSLWGRREEFRWLVAAGRRLLQLSNQPGSASSQ